ncbi:hypothetical protein H6776_01835 [Candidatus Nomurabacteria bacterium]|nr:hypothetical protein [Candidatus Nomurabacteria bacterium]
MSRFTKIIHSSFSILLFVIGFLSLGYMVINTSRAQVSPYVQLGAQSDNGIYTATSFTTSDASVDLFWLVNEVTSCTLTNVTAGTTVGTYTHTPAQFTGEQLAETITVFRPSVSTLTQSVKYTISCSATTGTTVSDSVTIKYMPTLDLEFNTAVSETVTAGTLDTSATTVHQVQNPVPIDVLQHPATVAFPPTLTSSVDLSIEGQLNNTLSGSISVTDQHSFALSWTATDVASCRLVNQTTGNTETSVTYVGGGTITSNYTALGNPYATADYSYTYRVTCYDALSNTVGSDRVTVNVEITGSNPVVGGCGIYITSFSIDQSDVYEDESDNDISLSWLTGSGFANPAQTGCSHSCKLTYDGVDHTVSDNDSDYDIYNIDEDTTFVLECYEDGNINNSVTSIERVDYHSATASEDTPDIHTLSAQQVGSSTARIRGTYDDGDCSTLRTGFMFGTSSANMTLLNGYTDRSGSGTVTAQLQGLSAGTTYYYRFIGDDCNGNLEGELKTFKTTGSNLPYQLPPTNTNTSSTTTTYTTVSQLSGTSGSGQQQVIVQDVEEDGTLGQAEYASFDIGLGYVPDYQAPRRGGIPLWLLIGGMLILLLIAGKFIYEAFTHPHSGHPHTMPRY